MLVRNIVKNIIEYFPYDIVFLLDIGHIYSNNVHPTSGQTSSFPNLPEIKLINQLIN